MKIFWININKLNFNDLLNKIKSDLISDNSSQNIVFTPNPEILLKTLKDEEFKELLEKATYLTADWIGLYIAFQINNNTYWTLINTLLLPYYIFNLFFRRKYLYEKYWDRICWSDLTENLVIFSEAKKIKITILDPYYPKDIAKVESQKYFKENLLKKFPKLDFDFFIYNLDKKEEIIKQIYESESKILFSTLWMKTQEKSVIEIIDKCPNIKLWLGIGSSFDYFTWFQKRAPKFFRTIWVEWLYRIVTWPQKIKRIKRLYNAIFVFIYQVLKNK